MFEVSSVRLAAPKSASGEIIRERLLKIILESQKRLTYIHAGAGFGKTTLLSQITNLNQNTIWLSLDSESDIFTFVNTLSEAVQQPYPGYDFIVSEYLPFADKDNLPTILANAFLNSMEKLNTDLILVLDDLHTIEDPQIRLFITCLIKYSPDNVRFYLGSREAPWQEFTPLSTRGNLLIISQKELVFTREETARILGFDDSSIYKTTEGWPIAVGSFKVLLESGVSLADVPSLGREALYSYLFFECISKLDPEIVDFLKTSACFAELDVEMLNAILSINNAGIMLECLVSRNIFTVKTGAGQYRYHALFWDYLLETVEISRKLKLQQKAARYYLDKKEYTKASIYAANFENKEILRELILKSYKDLIKKGDFNKLRIWFQAYGDTSLAEDSGLLLARGAHLSYIGNFVEAKKCLDAVMPLIGESSELYTEAMIHKARVIRNFVSFEESNKLLDTLIERLENITSETSYSFIIEKLYNLCWNSQINEAFSFAMKMIEACARAGNLKIKSWYERYLCAIHFFAGRMNESVRYYEKSLQLPENEQLYLEMHNIGIFAAKAYQMVGERERSLCILSSELQKLRNTGKYEEMWSSYLIAAEIHYQNTSIDIANGEDRNYETTKKYLTLAIEYAPVYRKTEFQMHWSKLQQLTYSLMFTNSPKEELIDEIFTNLEKTSDYLKTIILGRLFGYFASVSDFPNALKCAGLCIKIGEDANLMLIPTLAYGILCRAAIIMKEHAKAVELTRRYLQLCSFNGIYEYFKMRKAYGPILLFALENGIEPAITKEVMEFADIKLKKAYIETLGEFTVYPHDDRHKPLKMRTKKERELLAFLIDAGSQGVTKEQIYQAIWSESESEDVKKLIGVYLAHIKRDLAEIGLKNPIICSNKRYSICRDEIECDIDLFIDAAREFKLKNNKNATLKLLSLYKGDYLSDFEAFWATSKRIEYRNIYEEALKFGSSNILGL